jgi:hypothetical protein
MPDPRPWSGGGSWNTDAWRTAPPEEVIVNRLDAGQSCATSRSGRSVKPLPLRGRWPSGRARLLGRRLSGDDAGQRTEICVRAADATGTQGAPGDTLTVGVEPGGDCHGLGKPLGRDHSRSVITGRTVRQVFGYAGVDGVVCVCTQEVGKRGAHAQDQDR